MRFHWYWPFARSEELDWARATVRRGEQIVVQVIDRSEAPAAYRDDDGVLVVRDLPDVDRTASGVRWVPSRAQTYAARASARRAQWSGAPFDLVHLHYINRFTDAWTRLPRPLVMSVHDVVPHHPRLGRRAELAVLGRLYRRPDALIVHHARMATPLHDQFGIDTQRIHVVPHQVFPIGGVQPIDPPDGVPSVLFFGALRSNKGLDVLEEALRLVGPDHRVTIAGRGEPEQERLALAMAERDPRVRAEIGFATLERKRELFREASVVVLPYTRFASQSGVLHDAYGHGRPVVVTNVGALGEAVREDGTGLVVAPNDPGAIAGALRDVLEPANWRNYADAALRVAHDRSPTAVGARLRAVYDVVLA